MRIHAAIATVITAAAMLPAAAAQTTTSCQTYEQKFAVQKQELATAQKLHNRAAQATALLAIGELYDKDGKTALAINSFLQAQALEKIIGDRAGEAIAMARRANLYRNHNKQQQALTLLNSALSIARASRDDAAIGTVLSVSGALHSDRGDKAVAIELLDQALPMCRTAHNNDCELDTLNHMAWAYDELGQKNKALEYYNQALALSNSIGDTNRQASFLNNIAWVYQSVSRDSDALVKLKKSLPFARDACDLMLIGDTLGSIGVVYGHLRDARNELDNSRQSLLAEQQADSRDGQAYALWGMGDAASRLHNDALLLRSDLAARSIAKSVGDLVLLGNVDTTLMLFYRDRKQLQHAIFFGIDAVNSFQKIRRNISGMNEDIQAGFAQSKSQTYRQLAEVLVMNNQLPEAERVLDMLKEQEFREVVRGAEETLQTRTAPLQMTAPQARAQSGLAAPEKIAATLTSLSLDYEDLVALDSPTPAQQAHMQALYAQITAGNERMDDFLKQAIYEPVAQKAGDIAGNDVLKQVKGKISPMQTALAKLNRLGPGALGVQMLFGDDHVYALVVTADSTESYVLPIKPADLRIKVLHVRCELRNPDSDPTADLKELYRVLIGPWSATLDDFAQRAAKLHQTPTLLWSLDGVLRYLPMAALNDGQHYLVERFNNVLFTTQSVAYMQSPPIAGKPAFHALAMGLTRSYGGLPQLPGVEPELMSVVHDDSVPGSDGPMQGKLEINDQFTLANMRSQLRSGKYSVVHIASHFVEQAGSGQQPYLMLGGDLSGSASGYELKLADLVSSPMRFDDIKLLTLSACSTAKGDEAQNGMEMDSLGMAAQDKGAEAVLATLWDVNDASTSRMMSEFYTRWVNHAADGKAESLRQIQLEFLHGAITAPAGTASHRGLASDDHIAPPSGAHFAGYSHPYYWAPFILIGNYR